MQSPAQIVFHGLDHSDAVEQRVLEKVSKLDQYNKNIISCRVVIEQHHKNMAQDHRRGEPYLVSVIVNVPGEELVARSDKGSNAAMLKDHEDVGHALRDAFDAMERQLRDLADRRRTEHRVAAE